MKVPVHPSDLGDGDESSLVYKKLVPQLVKLTPPFRVSPESQEVVQEILRGELKFFDVTRMLSRTTHPHPKRLRAMPVKQPRKLHEKWLDRVSENFVVSDFGRFRLWCQARVSDLDCPEPQLPFDPDCSEFPPFHLEGQTRGEVGVIWTQFSGTCWLHAAVNAIVHSTVRVAVKAQCEAVLAPVRLREEIGTYLRRVADVESITACLEMTNLDDVHIMAHRLQLDAGVVTRCTLMLYIINTIERTEVDGEVIPAHKRSHPRVSEAITFAYARVSNAYQLALQRAFVDGDDDYLATCCLLQGLDAHIVLPFMIRQQVRLQEYEVDVVRGGCLTQSGEATLVSDAPSISRSVSPIDALNVAKRFSCATVAYTGAGRTDHAIAIVPGRAGEPRIADPN